MKPRFLLQRSQRFMWAFLRRWHQCSVGGLKTDACRLMNGKDKQRGGSKDNRFDRSINRYRSFLPINFFERLVMHLKTT